MYKLFNFLNSIQPLSLDLLSHLSGIVRPQKIAKKKYLLKPGRICSQISYLESGLLRCFYEKNGQEISSWFMKEGDIAISIESFFRQTPSVEFIQALEDSEIWSITHKELETIYSKFPEFNVIGRKVTENYYVLSDQRSKSMRHIRSGERYKFLLESYPELIKRVPSKYLASYLGITEVTLSSIKSKKLVY